MRYTNLTHCRIYLLHLYFVCRGYNFVTYGQDLQIIIGSPLDFSDLITKRRGNEIQSDEELFTLISLRIEKTLEELKLAGDEKLKRRLEQKK
jgi:hypothetical protein